MNFLIAVFKCPCLFDKHDIEMPVIRISDTHVGKTHETSTSYPKMFEKTANYPHGTVFRTQDEAVSALITAFQAHEKIGRDLHTAVNEIEISCGGWTAYIAQKVIEYIQVIVKDGGFLRGVLNESYKKAQAAVDEEHNFVRDHPVWAAAIVAVIALGICCLLAPWMLEAVGFAELGPVEGELTPIDPGILCTNTV